MRIKLSAIISILCIATLPVAGSAQSMGQEQIQEKKELNSMKSEISDIKSHMQKTINQLNDMSEQLSQGPDNEIHLMVKETRVEVLPGKYLDGLTYNGRMPGPTIRVREGMPLKVVLHNQSKKQTSLTFHGLYLPHSVAGLPRRKAGAVNPGEIFAYQFVPTQVGTFWYHPQVNNLQQKSLGLYGALIVEPAQPRHNYDRDFVLMFGQATVRAVSRPSGGEAESKCADAKTADTKSGDSKATAKGTEKGPDVKTAGARTAAAKAVFVGPTETAFTINGMTGSTMAPIEVRKGERIRLRLINASNQAIPLSLTGHKLEVVAINGSDALEPHTFRDTLTLNPSDRVDAEFTADNPGVWSLASEIPEQASDQGVFPGGIACVVKYIEYGNQ
jgi:FtsP/CotA-like multicopper oxidase with cupredoxin domain